MATRQTTTALLILAVVTAGCKIGREDEAQRRPAKPRPAGVHLSPEARQHAGLMVETVAKSPQPSSLAATGWLVARPGSEVPIKAPVTGFVQPPSLDRNVRLGWQVDSPGQPLGSIQIVLSPSEQADLVAAKEQADVAIRQAQTSLQLAQAQLKRVRQSKDVVAGTRLAELQEKVEHARAAYEEAQEELPFLPREPYDESIQMKPVAIRCPLAGTVISVDVQPGQFVTQGQPLWTVADWSVLWVRVPVFELDLPRVQLTQPARLQVPGTNQSLVVQPIDAPQPTRFGQRTVDCYYEVPNRSPMLRGEEKTGTSGVTAPAIPARSPTETGAGPVLSPPLRVGQAVRVLLPTGKTEDRVTVPRAAILWDGMGSTWVFVEAPPNTFRRRPVQLGPIHGDRVVVVEGLDAGEQLVTGGAEVLFAEQRKDEIAVEDDD